MDEGERVVVIKCSGDWTDANVGVVVVPRSVDLDQAKRDYKRWYNDEYRPRIGTGAEYLSFDDWLIRHGGGRVPTDDEAIVIGEE